MARLQLRHGDAADRATVPLGEGLDRFCLGVEHLNESVGELESGLQGIRESRAVIGANGQPIDDHRDVVILPPVQLRRIGHLDERSIDVRADEALLAHRLEELAEFTLAAANERSAHLDLGSVDPCEYGFGDLRRALPLDRAPATRAVRRTRARVEQAQVIVDLGDRSDGRPRVVAGSLLLDRDGGRQTVDGIDVRLLHEAEELPRVGGERLDVSPLAFRVDGIEGQRGLARPRQPRNDREAVPRDGDVHVAEVVLARAADDQCVFCHNQGKVASGPW